MKIFLAIFLAFSISLAEHNLTKELINKEMIKQISSLGDTWFEKSDEKFCYEFLKDLKTGKDITVFAPMSKEEYRNLVDGLFEKYGEEQYLNSLFSTMLAFRHESSAVYDLKDGYLTEERCCLSDGGSGYYRMSFYNKRNGELDINDPKHFFEIIHYPYFAIRYNAMHKPIKYKDKYYLIQTHKTKDHLNEKKSERKNNIIFTMHLFDLSDNNSTTNSICNVYKRTKKLNK